MTEDLVRFTWDVSPSGHYWLRTSASKSGSGQRIDTPIDDFLTDGRQLSTHGGGGRHYEPLTDNPELFLTFSEVEPSREGIVSFADRYGLLGADVSQQIVLPGPRTIVEGFDLGNEVAFGELESAWVHEITMMRRAFSVWQAAKSGSSRQLKQFVRWERQGDRESIEFLDGRGKCVDWIAVRDAPVLQDAVRAHDLVVPAYLYLQRIVNRHRDGRVSLRMTWDSKFGHPRDNVVPEGLIGGMWLQMSKAVDGGTDFRSCKQCGRWYLVHPDYARTSRQFCSDKCRVQAHRNRKIEARSLHDSGVPIDEIAQQLGTSVGTVRGWLSQPAKAGSRPSGAVTNPTTKNR